MMFAAHIVLNAISVIVGGSLLFFKARRDFRIYNKIVRLPTSRIDAAAVGNIELKGSALAKVPLKSPIQGKECITYQLIISRWKHSGKSSNWVEIYRGVNYIPFTLKDDYGEIKVDPKGALIKNAVHYSEERHSIGPELNKIMQADSGKACNTKAGILQKITFAKAVSLANALSLDMSHESRYRLEEVYLPLGASSYVLGYAEERDEGLVVSGRDDFIITDDKEADLLHVYLFDAAVVFILSVFLIIFGMLSLYNISDWIKYLGGF